MGAKKWSAADEAFLLANSPRLSYAEIGAAVGRSAKAVKNKSLNLGLLRPDPPRAFTSEEDAYIRENFATSPLADVAAHLGRHVESVRQRSRLLGLVHWAVRRPWRAGERLRPAVHSDYFSEIDTPIKAYVLGLMASDGSIASGSNSVGINLHRKDAAMVELVRDELSPESALHSYLLAPLPGYSTWRPVTSFAVRCAQMKADLIKLGITPRKTFTIQYPELAPHLENSFILGSFDGDGCLYVRNPRPGQWRWELYSASPAFLVATREAVFRHTGLELIPGTSNRGLHRLRLNGGRSVEILDAWLHADVPGLDRKRLEAGAYTRAAQEASARRSSWSRQHSLALYPPEKREQVHQLRAQGLSLDQITAETGVSRSVVYRWIKRAALEATAR